MGLYFGTDGLRGIVNSDLSIDTVYRVGNAITKLKKAPNVVIGSDTRISNSYLTLAVSNGIMSGGGKVIDVGIIPSGGISYLTQKMHFDFGIMITASHNSKEYNGVKIFDSNGYKLSDKDEEVIERNIINTYNLEFPNIGSYTQHFNLTKIYTNFLLSTALPTKKPLKIVIDASNGSAFKIAPLLFKKLGHIITCINCKQNGLCINHNCGALHPQNLVKKVLDLNADIGFAFDGDADRLIVVDKNGNIIDGDMILYLLAINYKNNGMLLNNAVVGTSHTNLAIELGLKEKDIELIRTDIGDKYVLRRLIDKKLSLGGEQSGHIILKNLMNTGDGLLTAIAVCNILTDDNTDLSKLVDITPLPQANLAIHVEDKLKIINNHHLNDKIREISSYLAGFGRIMVRASGTEPKIRIMVESCDSKLNLDLATKVQSIINEIDKEV